MRRAKSHWRNFMTVKRERKAGTLKPGRAIAAMALLFTLSGVKQLPDKLVAERNKTVETEKGYEFQYSPSSVSLAELAKWVADEGRCCPFFDFHIDLEREGSLLCLRLTGTEG